MDENNPVSLLVNMSSSNSVSLDVVKSYQSLHFPDEPQCQKSSNTLSVYSPLYANIRANLTAVRGHFEVLSALDLTAAWIQGPLCYGSRASLSPLYTYSWLSPRHDHSMMMKVSLLLLGFCLDMRHFMIPVNTRYHCRTGITKALNHKIEPSDLERQCFPILTVTTGNPKNSTRKRLPGKQKYSLSLRRTEQIPCSLYDLVNEYEQCHASISSQQPCSGLANREEKKQQGGIKRRSGPVWKSHAYSSPLPIHLPLNHRMVENLVNGKGEFQLRHNLCTYSVSSVQGLSFKLKLVTLYWGGPKQTDLYLSILFLVTYF